MAAPRRRADALPHAVMTIAEAEEEEVVPEDMSAVMTTAPLPAPPCWGEVGTAVVVVVEDTEAVRR